MYHCFSLFFNYVFSVFFENTLSAIIMLKHHSLCCNHELFNMKSYAIYSIGNNNIITVHMTYITLLLHFAIRSKCM